MMGDPYEDNTDWCAKCGAEHDYMCGPCEKCGNKTFTKKRPKPRIIVLSADDDDVFDWLSDGWFMVEQRHTEKAQELMKRAKQAITEGVNVPDAIKKLEAAGFEIVRDEGKRCH
jgi:hypothetical protein